MTRLPVALVLTLCLATSAIAGDDDDDTRDINGEFTVSQNDVFESFSDTFRVHPGGRLEVTGGRISAGRTQSLSVLRRNSDAIDIRGDGTVDISGGVIEAVDDGIKAKDQGTVFISGGSIDGLDDGISATDSSRVLISGGTVSGDIQGLHTVDLARINVSGGTILGTSLIEEASSLTVSGGGLDAIQVRDDASVKILGGEFRNVIELFDDAIAVRFFDETGKPLTGGSGAFGNIVGNNANPIYDVTAVQEDTHFEELSQAIGVLNAADGEHVVVSIDDGVLTDTVYVAENSTVNYLGGDVTRFVVDDDGFLNIDGGQLGARPFGVNSRVTAIGSSMVQISNGTINATAGLAGLRLRGYSQSVVDGGRIGGGISLSSSATLTMNSGEVIRESFFWTDADVGITAEDSTQVTVNGGLIRGHDAGVSIRDEAEFRLNDGTVTGQLAGIQATDDTSTRIRGGEINGDVLLRNLATLKISDGLINGDLIASDNTIVSIDGGEIADDLRLDRGSFATVTDGIIRGDLEARDLGRLEVYGGQILGSINAQDQSIVRLFGQNMAQDDGRITGQLFDGSAIDSAVTTRDGVSVVAFESLTERGTFDNRQGNIAVFGDGPQEHVDFDANSVVDGDLIVLDDGRANILGGTISGSLTAVRQGVIAFYGTDWSREVLSQETRVRGTLADGSEVDYRITNDQFDELRDVQVLTYEVIRRDTTISNENQVVDGNFAVFDGADGPTLLTIEQEHLVARFDVRESSRLDVRSAISSGEVLARDTAGISLDGTGEIVGGKDGIFAQDSSQITIDGNALVFAQRDGIRVWDDSELTMTGGWVGGNDDGVDVKNDGTAMITGGRVSGGNMGIKAKNRSVVMIGGDASIVGNENAIDLSEDSRLVVSGDAFVGAFFCRADCFGINATEDSVVEVEGGTIAGETAAAVARDDAVINVRGGFWNSGLIAAGGTINIFGEDLVLDGDRLTGRLDDGSLLNVLTTTEDGGRIVLSSIRDIACDFSEDGACNLLDLDALLFEGLGTADTTFDLDGNGVVDLADRDEWFRIAERTPGDLNFDGIVNSVDLNVIGVNWQQDDQLSYADGDTDGNGIIDSEDLNVVGVNWTPGFLAAPVPEPRSNMLLLICLATTAGRIRQRRSC